jgi:hypothetical protein
MVMITLLPNDCSFLCSIGCNSLTSMSQVKLQFFGQTFPRMIGGERRGGGERRKGGLGGSGGSAGGVGGLGDGGGGLG